MYYNTEDLLVSAKNSEFFPTGQNTFTDTMLISYGSEEQQIRIVPHIMKMRQQFFKDTKQTNIVGNLRRYSVPERAIGTTFRTLFYMPDATNIDVKYRMTKVDSEDIQGNYVTGTAPYGYDLSGDEVLLVPKPQNSTGAILFSYYRRPNQLSATSDCTKITDVSSAAGSTTFTVDTDMSSAWVVGGTLDIISGRAPFFSWSDDVVITSITSTTVVVDTTSVQDESGAVEPRAGDYICPAKYSNVPQLPSEYHSILAELIAWRALKASGAQQNLAACGANVKDMLEQVATLIENRVETSPDLIFEPNGLIGALGGRNYSSFTR